MGLLKTTQLLRFSPQEDFRLEKILRKIRGLKNVGDTRFELVTPCVSSKCSAGLS